MFKREVKYWFLVVVLSYAPVITVELLEKILWYHTEIHPGHIIEVDAIFTVLIFPYYLTYLNYSLAKKYGKDSLSFIINCFLVITCVLAAFTMCANSYADSRGIIDDPEGANFAANSLEGIISLIVTFLFLMGYYSSFMYYRNRVNTIETLRSQKTVSANSTVEIKLKYWFFVVVLSYGVVYTSHFLAGLWWLYDAQNHVGEMITEGVLTVLALPVYLVRINYVYAKKYNQTKHVFVGNTIIIFSCIYLSIYMNWQHCFPTVSLAYYSYINNILIAEAVIAAIITLVGVKDSFKKLPV